MKPLQPGEFQKFLLATLVLMIVLLASFMCVQLYKLRKSKFIGYCPTCDDDHPRKSKCHGYTTGVMPSIDADRCYNLCCGYLGVPP